MIDPRNGIDSVMDVAIDDGVIAAVGADIDASLAESVVDADGLYVTPGLVDLHTHVFFGTEPDAYLSNSFDALPPDGFTFRAGVTTVIDLGDAGWRNFVQFKEQVIDRSRTRVLSFLNIVGSGMKGGPIEQNLLDMDPKLTAMRTEEFSELIVGIKVAHYIGEAWEPVDRAVEAGRLAGVPVAVDFGRSTPTAIARGALHGAPAPGGYPDARVRERDRAGWRSSTTTARSGLLCRGCASAGLSSTSATAAGSFRFDQAVPAMRQWLPPRHDQHRSAYGEHELRHEEHAQRDVQVPEHGDAASGRRRRVDVETGAGHRPRRLRPLERWSRSGCRRDSITRRRSSALSTSGGAGSTEPKSSSAS